MIGIIVFLIILVVVMAAFIAYILGWMGGMLEDEVTMKYEKKPDYVDGEIVDVR